MCAVLRSEAWGILPRYAAAWQGLRIRVHHLRSFLRPDVVLLEGCTANDRPVRMLRAGIAGRDAEYFFAGQVLTELRREEPLGRAWLWALPAVARKKDCAFVLLRTAQRRVALARWLLGRGDDDAFYLPLFVGATVDLTDEARLLRSHSIRDDVRRIKKSGFQYSTSTRKEDLQTFMQRYHGPYVKRIHGFDAVGVDMRRLLASSSSDEIPEPWVLLKVELDGEWVGGGLLVSGPGRAALMEVGVKEADSAYVKRGALQAAYWLSLEYFRSQGHARASLMYARPFLRGGVLQYKLKFSPSLKPRAADGFLLLPVQGSDAAREILLQEPLLVLRRDALRAIWFSTAVDEPRDHPWLPIEHLARAGITDVERVVLPSGVDCSAVQ